MGGKTKEKRSGSRETDGWTDSRLIETVPPPLAAVIDGV